jgi:hypothetical protein
MREYRAAVDRITPSRSGFAENVIRRLWAKRDDPFVRPILRGCVRDLRWWRERIASRG